MRTRRTWISRRQREARRRRRLRRFCIAVAVAMLCVAAMAPRLRTHIAVWLRGGVDTVAAAFASAQAEVTLPKRQVYAIQLGVYDSGERAQSEMQRLTAAGVPCVIWQREQMRIVCDASISRDGLQTGAAQGQEAYVVQETLGEVVLRVSADGARMEDTRALITLPDDLLTALSGKKEALSELIERTRAQATAALTAHPEHALYTQLAQSLVNWCQLIERTEQERGEEIARSYARVTICTLCYELRQELLQSAASTASAQRTPSTAADVMPPA